MSKRKTVDNKFEIRGWLPLYLMKMQLRIIQGFSDWYMFRRQISEFKSM